MEIKQDLPKELPLVPQKAPFKIEVEAGKKYFWCSCGMSKNQPFCDGAHKGTGLKSVVFEATESKLIYFCGCKHSKNGIFCDGAHNKL
ncbi:MAG: Iron-binding zinc finger type [Rickettsiaceae bacterium]|jgi:CDGSH-type Zn-finger protein|nr:Iron-binding zinc finger type [Rickettsiaceae bacterium]